MPPVPSDVLDIGHIKGNEIVKQGLLIAATGRHNVLLVGPPGEGKSSIASTLPGFIIGDIDACINDYQLCGHQFNRSSLTSGIHDVCPRFIEVGPNITESGLLGGGRILKHGAITDAHNGVLFMDEFPQFDKGLLESLRTPMESHQIVIKRNGVTRIYPCDFQLVAAMNPCPCGYFGTNKCTCTESQVNRYTSRLSGPILDRVDIFLYMTGITSEDRFKPSTVGQSKYFKQRVLKAIQFRVDDRNQHYFNRNIHSKDIYNESSHVIKWHSSGLAQFKKHMDRDSFSTRKGVRLARLCRTVADLLEHPYIIDKHIFMVEDFLVPPNRLLE